MAIAIKIPKKLLNKSTINLLVPKILAGVSVIGNVAASYLFAKKSFELGQKSVDADISPKEAIKEMALPGTMLLISNGCTVALACHSVATISSLLASNAFMAKQFTNYREVTKELYGESADILVQKEIVRKNTVQEIIDDKNIRSELNSDTILFFSPWHDEYFLNSKSELDEVFEQANKLYKQNGFLYLNQLFRLLHWGEIEDADLIGWDMIDGWDTLDFETHYKTVEGSDGEFVDIYFLVFPYEPYPPIPEDE